MAGKNKHQRTPLGLFMELGIYGEAWIRGKAGAWVCGIDLAVELDTTVVIVGMPDAKGRLFEPLTITRSGSTPTDAIKALHRAYEAHAAKEIDEAARANDGAEAVDQTDQPEES